MDCHGVHKGEDLAKKESTAKNVDIGHHDIEASLMQFSLHLRMQGNPRDIQVFWPRLQS